MTMRVHRADDPGRREVEAFIAAVYDDRFGARVKDFAPELVSLRKEETIVAAAGYRTASESLFLERYLDEPIEAVLHRCTGVPAAREAIVEIGHLSMHRATDSRRLFRLLVRHLSAEGLQWGVSTLTAELRRLLTRMGIAPIAIGLADPARLGAAADDWGCYYEHRPVVAAGRLSLAQARLEDREEAR